MAEFVEKLEKRVEKLERKQDNSGVRKEPKGMGKRKGLGDGRGYEPRGFPALKADR